MDEQNTVTPDRLSYVIAVTGGRDYNDRSTIAEALRRQIADAYSLDRMPILLVGGCNTGADEIARQWWHMAERPYIVVPARWTYHRRGAGPTRNSAMAIGSGLYMDPPLHPDVLIAFPGGDGTADMRRKCEAMGIPIVVVT